jgi:UDP-N-acetylmuramyl pentapeptide phosphotransferase/UDP-N-acetylglucosamine-1-phosphate transferase
VIEERIDVAAAVLPLAWMAMLVSVVTALALARYGGALFADLPGRHRSHVTPTPRGGGVGIALALLVALAGMFAGAEAPLLRQQAGLLAAGIALIAAVGLYDDWRGASISTRLLVQIVAAGAVAVALAPGVGLAAWQAALVSVAVALLLVASINLHNFMDGANGLLAMHAASVSAFVLILAAGQRELLTALIAAVCCAGTIGFLPFNWPRARVFLGDAGSGTLGLVLGALGVLAWRDELIALPLVLVLLSGFLTDAGYTLVYRMLRGRRWYNRHREHLYQWLIRARLPNAGAAPCYLAWNLCVAFPVIVIADEAAPALQWGAAASVYALALAAWWGGKRAILRARRQAG